MDPIARLNAALEGRYRIERQLGEGGMATVYLADDLKHERKVALKVLKPELAAVVGAERFLAEIKTTANLQHPHILPLHDSGEADGFLFYVMPYVEGESLREKLDRDHQLPVDDAVRIATNVAEALDYAHSHGVIHRDIKPANILLHAGNPVISDFGIALAVGAAGGGRLTETGLSLGTPHYMSPEQATGDAHVGPATDIYALGCVLYEMLVGEPPYTGTSAQAVLGKIIAGAPVSATEIRKSVPGNLDAAIRKALEKLPADRFTGAQDFAKALADPSFRHGDEAAAGVAAGVGPWKQLTMVGWSVAALATLALGWLLLRPAPPAPVVRFRADFADDQQLVPGQGVNLALSGDGSWFVYAGPHPTSGTQLWRCPLAQLEPEPIRGTESARNPVVSPDGSSVAFTAAGSLNTVSLLGGPASTLVPAGVPNRGGAGIDWGDDGMIYFMDHQGSIQRIRASGGEPETVATPESPTRFAWVDALPEGRGVLLAITRGGPANSEIAVVGPEGGEVRSLGAGTMARYASSGHIVYATSDFSLLAAPFDLGSLEISGQSVALLEGVDVSSVSSASQFALSKTGTLLYMPAAAGGTVEFVWVTRSGEATPVEAGWSFVRGRDPGWSLSPNGTRLALKAETDAGADIWVKQLPDGPLSRLTFHEGVDTRPRWAPDGEAVTFLSDRSGNWDVWSQRADGTGEPQVLFEGESLLNAGVAFWSPDGEWLVLRTGGSGGVVGVGGRHILALRPGVDSVPLPLLTEEYDEQGPALSPDGRWLAYVSTETGSQEVFVRPFPDVDSGKTQVSTDGGSMPVWAHSGRELFYVDGNRAFVATQVETDPSFQVGAKETLFTLPAGYPSAAPLAVYDIAPDDQRFLMVRPYQGDSQEEAGSPSRPILVQNFFEELKARVPN